MPASISRISGTRRAVVRLPDGHGSAGRRAGCRNRTEGAAVRVRITRAAIAEKGRTKLPQARGGQALTKCSKPRCTSITRRTRRRADARCAALLAHDRSFDDAWLERSGGGGAHRRRSRFPSGSLVISPTPAMTLIDVDGPPPLPALALDRCPRDHRRIAAARYWRIGRHRLSLRCPKKPSVRRSMPRWPKPRARRAGRASARA